MLIFIIGALLIVWGSASVLPFAAFIADGMNGRCREFREFKEFKEFRKSLTSLISLISLNSLALFCVSNTQKRYWCVSLAHPLPTDAANGRCREFREFREFKEFRKH